MAIKGEFKRSDAKWRDWISREPDAKFPAAKGRYHLYVAYACPWAHRTLMVRALKGLQDVITVTAVHPTWKRTRPNDPEDMHAGWVFGKDDPDLTFVNSIGLGGPFSAKLEGCEPDPFFDAQSVRDIYERCGDSSGVRSVPILFDKEQKTIVSNESSEIIRMLNSEFNEFAMNPDLDLYAEEDQVAIDEVNQWIYTDINNGVYRCGFAKSQEAYNDAIGILTEAFDRVATILKTQRFIAGDHLTEADIRLFSTLVRFDEVYVVYFKTNTRSIITTPSLLNYCREIYQLPGIQETVDMNYTKMHYFTSHPTYNHFSIIPKGPDIEKILQQPHDRDNL